jgi:hypothetical protein
MFFFFFMFVVPYILIIYAFIQFQVNVLYALFLSWKILSSTCLGCYLHPSSGAQLQCRAIGFYLWKTEVLVWSGVKVSQHQYPLNGIKHTKTVSTQIQHKTIHKETTHQNHAIPKQIQWHTPTHKYHTRLEKRIHTNPHKINLHTTWY